MITVHHLENSRSQRLLWLLEELQHPYTVKRYERDSKTMLAPPALKAVHPLGKSPVITDDARTIAETGAIIEYVLQRYGKDADGKRLLTPEPDSDAWLDYTYYMHYAEGSLMPLLVMTLIFTQIPKSPMPFLVRPVAKGLCGKVRSSFLAPQIDTHLKMVESHLANQQWFAGDTFTAADIQMSFPLEAAAARAGSMDRYPAIGAFLERIHARPAYQRALTQGGPYRILG